MQYVLNTKDMDSCCIREGMEHLRLKGEYDKNQALYLYFRRLGAQSWQHYSKNYQCSTCNKVTEFQEGAE